MRMETAGGWKQLGGFEPGSSRWQQSVDTQWEE